MSIFVASNLLEFYIVLTSGFAHTEIMYLIVIVLGTGFRKYGKILASEVCSS